MTDFSFSLLVFDYISADAATATHESHNVIYKVECIKLISIISEMKTEILFFKGSLVLQHILSLMMSFKILTHEFESYP